MADEGKGFWGNFADGATDRLAASRDPLLGGLGYAIQAERNTPGYQKQLAQKAARAQAREAAAVKLEDAKARLADYKEGAYARELERQNKEDAEERKRFDNFYLDQKKAFPTALQGSGMTQAEMDQLWDTPEIQTDVSLKYAMMRAQGLTQNDPRAYRFFGNFLNARGWKVVDGTDGDKTKYLDMGKDKDGNPRRRPITGEEIDKLNARIGGAAQNELKTRMRLSAGNALGNPGLNSEKSFVEKAAPYFRNSYSNASRLYNQIASGATQGQRLWRETNQAIKDFNSNAPAAARMDGVLKLMIPSGDPQRQQSIPPVFQQLGIAAEGMELFSQTGNVNDLKLKMIGSDNEWHDVSFSDIAKMAEEKDELGHALTARLDSMQRASMVKDKKYYDRAIAIEKLAKARAEAVIAQNKANSKTDKVPKEEETPGVTQEQYDGMAKLFGDAFIDVEPEQQQKLYNVMSRIGDEAKREGVLVQDKSGQWRIAPDADRSMINKFAGIEDDQFAKIGLKALKGKGYFSRIIDEQDQTKDLERSEKRAETAKQMMTPQKDDKSEAKGFLARSLENMGNAMRMNTGATISAAQSITGDTPEKNRKRLKKTRSHLSK